MAEQHAVLIWFCDCICAHQRFSCFHYLPFFAISARKSSSCEGCLGKKILSATDLHSSLSAACYVVLDQVNFCPTLDIVCSLDLFMFYSFFSWKFPSSIVFSTLLRCDRTTFVARLKFWRFLQIIIFSLFVLVFHSIPKSVAHRSWLAEVTVSCLKFWCNKDVEITVKCLTGQEKGDLANVTRVIQ